MFRISKILCPIDFSTCSERAAERAVELAQHFGAELVLLHCYEQRGYAMPDLAGWTYAGEHRPLAEIARDAAQVRLDEVRQTLTAPDGARWLLAEGSPAASILEEANRGGYDLLVLGTHGRTGLQHLLIGSVAQRVMRSARCPVLIVR
jgi:nucleotide-binding universal stress UspA family protein